MMSTFLFSFLYLWKIVNPWIFLETPPNNVPDRFCIFSAASSNVCVMNLKYLQQIFVEKTNVQQFSGSQFYSLGTTTENVTKFSPCLYLLKQKIFLCHSDLASLFH